MSVPQKFFPVALNTDADETNLSSNEGSFLKNLTFDSQDNNAATPGLGEGGNGGVLTPPGSNARVCPDFVLPSGRNETIGTYEDKDTNETYVFNWNSSFQHHIYRINGKGGNCQMVYKGSCLNFQLNHRHFIGGMRCILKTIDFYNKDTDKEETRKYLIFTDDLNPQRFIDVEASIATNSFDNIAHPYFNSTDPDCFRCDYINLGLKTPMRCIGVMPVVRDMSDPDEAAMFNAMLDQGFQWRVREVDRWGRTSEYGVISDRYFASTGSGCLNGSSGLPRCVDLTISAGCPFIEKIEILVRKCGANVKGLSVTPDWFLYDTISKYDDCSSNVWYQRDINPDLNYDLEANTFTYRFCNNKECTPVDVNATNRSENPLAITSGVVGELVNGIFLARNRRHYPPLDCSVLEKFGLTVTAPNAGSDCSNQNILRKIIIYAVIYNPFDETIVRLRTKNDIPVFGVSDCSKNNPFTFGQVLPKGQEGFIAYLAGTKSYAISKQYRYNLLNASFEYTGLNYTVPGGIETGFYIPVQRFEMDVMPGKYVLRLAGHRSAAADDFQKTSTYLKGVTAFANVGQVVTETSELIIDVCTQDYDSITALTTPLMIYDLTRIGKGCAVADATNVVEGYIREDEISRNPIERAFVDPSRADSFYSHYTDHNGHYFAAYRGKGLNVRLRGQKACANNVELAVSDTSFDNSTTWYRYNELYAYKGTTPYPLRDRYKIRGRVTLCGSTSVGVPGVLVVHTRGYTAMTDADGYFTLLAHANGDSGTRTDDIIYSQRGVCQLLSCDSNCLVCFPNATVNAPACTTLERIATVADLVVKIKGLNKRGPKMGGRYGWGVKAFDWMGRETFVQALDDWYIDIPSLQSTQTFDFSTISFVIQNTISLPLWVKYLTFYFTENLNWDDDLTWIAERVQFVDNTGKTNNAAPTQIRLYYESLAEYNKQNNYSTNTTWDIITSDDTNVLGDQVEILANGDGIIFNKRIVGLVKYDKEGKYFTIDYDGDLGGLKDGALFRFIRPKQCINKEFYYELCPVIRVINGVPQTLTGTFNFFDSYLQNRQIPVPVSTSTTDPDTGEITTTTDNQIRSFPFLFEHPSPSDKWGDHCVNKGRVNTKNPYENQQINKMEIAISGAISNNGIINYLNYYTEAGTFILDEEKRVGIVGVIVRGSELLIICERGNFTISYDDTEVKADSDGKVYVPSLANRFGKPRLVVGSQYGVDIEDHNTIRMRDERVFFVDRNHMALVLHTFGEATDVSFNKFKSWLSSKIKYIVNWNATDSINKKYLHAAIDPKLNEYLLSDFTTKEVVTQPAEDFVNTDRVINETLHETLAIGYKNGLIEFRSYTPEYFGTLQGDSKDAQLFSFRRGEAWFHHQLRNNTNSYLNFFGTQCEWVVEIVGNLDKSKIKRFLTLEVYVKEIAIYADRIITESGQTSRLMPRWWDRRERFWTGDFKCDLQTPTDTNLPTQTGVNALLDGDVLYGTWLKVRLLPHPNYINKYFEISELIMFLIGSEKSSDK